MQSLRPIDIEILMRAYTGVDRPWPGARELGRTYHTAIASMTNQGVIQKKDLSGACVGYGIEITDKGRAWVGAILRTPMPEKEVRYIVRSQVTVTSLTDPDNSDNYALGA